MDSIMSGQGALESVKSIGTLTSWQLLAEKASADDSSSTDADEEDRRFQEADHVDETHQGFTERSFTSPNPYLSQLRSPSFFSPRKTGSAATVPDEAKCLVTPKQHQMLYKEYRVFNEIGSGAFGRVCVARRLADGKDVVVKEIKTSSLSGKIKAATMAEVQVLASLNHPNIVKFLDCFMDDSYINIVMELCTAGDLAKLLKARGGQLLPEHRIMFLFVQICLALQYTHEAGVLHRDLKAGNCMLTTPASTSQSSSSIQADYANMPLLKLGDFGVAKVAGADGSMANTVVGTPQYLPPEMIDNKPYGRKSDVWALGCILYELCSLRKAFESDKIPVIFYKIAMGQYDPLPESCSSDLQELVGKLLSRNVTQRPTVSEILSMPFVRMHLCLYLEWARGVPEAQPQVLLAGMGEQWSRTASSSVSIAAAAPAAAMQKPVQLQVPGSAGVSRAGSQSYSNANSPMATSSHLFDSPRSAAATLAAAVLAGSSPRSSSLQPGSSKYNSRDLGSAVAPAQMAAATPAAASSAKGSGPASPSSSAAVIRVSSMQLGSEVNSPKAQPAAAAVKPGSSTAGRSTGASSRSNTSSSGLATVSEQSVLCVSSPSSRYEGSFKLSSPPAAPTTAVPNKSPGSSTDTTAAVNPAAPGIQGMPATVHQLPSPPSPGMQLSRSPAIDTARAQQNSSEASRKAAAGESSSGPPQQQQQQQADNIMPGPVVGSRLCLVASSNVAGAAVVVSVVPKRESCTDSMAAAAAEPKSFQQLSSKQQQDMSWKQQQRQKSPSISPLQSPPQVSPTGSTRASRQPSRRSTGSVPIYSMDEWLEGDVNLASVMQLQQQRAAGAVTGAEGSGSVCLPVLPGRTTPTRLSAAASDSVFAATATELAPPSAQQQQQQQEQQQEQHHKKAANSTGAPSSMSSAYGLMSLQEIDYSNAAAGLSSSAATSKSSMHMSSSSAPNSSGNDLASGSQAIPLVQVSAPVSPDVRSWVAGLPDSSPAAIAMQKCAERASAAQIEVSDALKYSLDLSSANCSGANSCSNSNTTLPRVAAPGIVAAAAAAAAAAADTQNAVADAASSKDSAGLPVTAIVLEQQEMLRRLKAFKGRLGSSGGAAPAQAMRHGGGRLSPSLSLASSFTTQAYTGGRQDGLSCRSAGRENSSSAVATKWGTHYI